MGSGYRKGGIKMVKTHPKSRFVLKSLAEIRDSRDVILQIVETDSAFTDSKQSVYMCEVVSAVHYDCSKQIDSLVSEIVKVNAENRRLRKKIDQYERRGC
jgi:hypothetical protein